MTLHGGEASNSRGQYTPVRVNGDYEKWQT